MSQEYMPAEAGGRTLDDIQSDFDQGMPAYGQPESARPVPPQGYAAQQVPPQGYAQQVPPQGYAQQVPPQGYGAQQVPFQGYGDGWNADGPASTVYRGPEPNAYYDPNAYGYHMNLPMKSKIAGALLHILLGSFGVGNFYLGKIGLGIVDVIFCWTGIPAIVNLVRGILILVGSREEFENKYHCISTD